MIPLAGQWKKTLGVCLNNHCLLFWHHQNKCSTDWGSAEKGNSYLCVDKCSFFHCYTYVVWTLWNCFSEAIPKHTHNIWFEKKLTIFAKNCKQIVLLIWPSAINILKQWKPFQITFVVLKYFMLICFYQNLFTSPQFYISHANICCT